MTFCGRDVAVRALCRSSRVHLSNPADVSRSWSPWVLGVVGREKSLRSRKPPRLGQDLEVNLAEPHQEPRIAGVVRRDEELGGLGPEEFIAFFDAGASHEECVRQLMNAEKQLVAYPERGKPVVRSLRARGQRQGDPADVLFGDHLRMLRQPTATRRASTRLLRVTGRTQRPANG